MRKASKPIATAAISTTSTVAPPVEDNAEVLLAPLPETVEVPDAVADRLDAVDPAVLDALLLVPEPLAVDEEDASRKRVKLAQVMIVLFAKCTTRDLSPTNWPVVCGLVEM